MKLEIAKNPPHGSARSPSAYAGWGSHSGDRVPEKGRLYYRPLGGTIEFGERGEEAVRREFREEIAADLADVRYLGMLENIFTYDGRRGHEIVLVYDGLLTDASLYK